MKKLKPLCQIRTTVHAYQFCAGCGEMNLGLYQSETHLVFVVSIWYSGKIKSKNGSRGYQQAFCLN